MSQIEVSKVVQHVYTAPPSDSIAAAKVVMYIWATPGGDDGEAERQAHVYSQKIRRG